ncbi:hypothetical protein [Mycobacterium simiae]|nr:hypothetical protein [Mycobacterium simiae]
MGYVTAVIVVTLAIVGIGIVINELLRLRSWLKSSPPHGDDAESPEDIT